MGIYSNNYIPHLKKNVDNSEVGYEFVTADNVGKFTYTNSDDFKFVSNNGTVTTLSELKEGVNGGMLKKIYTITETDLAGTIVELIPTAPSGYINVLHKILVVYEYGTIPFDFTDITPFVIQAYRDGTLVDYHYITMTNLFEMERSGVYPTELNINTSSALYLYNAFDLNTGYFLKVTRPTTNGDGTIKILVYYNIEAIN